MERATGRHSNMFILTQEAHDLFDRELQEWWKNSNERMLNKDGNPRANPKKLSREVKASILGLDRKTVDSILGGIPVSESVLRVAFDALDITFLKEYRIPV